MLWVDWNVSVSCTGTRANFKMTFLNISNAHHHMRVRRCPLRSGESVVCCVWRCSVWFHIKVGRHQAALRCDCTSALHLMCHFLFPSFLRSLSGSSQVHCSLQNNHWFTLLSVFRKFSLQTLQTASWAAPLVFPCCMEDNNRGFYQFYFLFLAHYLHTNILHIDDLAWLSELRPSERRSEPRHYIY